MTMRVEWHKPMKPRVAWLGIPNPFSYTEPAQGNPSASQTKAKAILWQWSQDNPSASPLSDYGTAIDFTGYWSSRDQQMLEAFIKWWNAKYPNEQLACCKLSAEASAALDTYATGVVKPATFPTYGGQAPVPTGGGAQVIVPEVPVPQQDCVKTCLQATGVPPGSPGYLYNTVNCVAQCTGVEPTITCNDPSLVWDPVIKQCVKPSTVAAESKPSALPWVIAGVAGLGVVGWLLLRGGSGVALQENANLWTSLGSWFSGRGESLETRHPKLKMTKAGRDTFAQEWKRVFPDLDVPDIEDYPGHRVRRTQKRKRRAE